MVFSDISISGLSETGRYPNVPSLIFSSTYESPLRYSGLLLAEVLPRAP